MKNHLTGKHFGTLKNVQKAVTDQLKAIPVSKFQQCKASYIRARRMVREQNARMYRWDCEPVLRRPRTVCMPFTEYQNLLIFCVNTKRTGFIGCPFHAPGVLSMPQVRGKLINHTPLTHRRWTAQRVSGALVYTKLYEAWEQRLQRCVASQESYFEGDNVELLFF